MGELDCVRFLQDVLPRLGLRWQGFRRVRGQVCKRLGRRAKALGLPDLAAYRARLEADPAEWGVLDELCRVTIARFYRDRAVWDRLREVELPRLARAAEEEGRPLHAWSAGCASGEEPYTLALVLRLGLDPAPRFEIVASDADPQLLERARAALYAPGTLRELPADWRARAFVPEGELLRLRPEHAAGIDWRRQDLRREMPEGPFDLLLCRNVAFTYFEPPLQREVLARLRGRLRPGGVLVLGAHERLPDESGWRRRASLPVFERA